MTEGEPRWLTGYGQNCDWRSAPKPTDGASMASYPTPATTVYASDADCLVVRTDQPAAYTPARTAPARPRSAPRNDGKNHLYMDGHVKWGKVRGVPPNQWTSQDD